MSVTSPTALPARGAKSSRRIKPEVLAQLTARKREQQLQQLYNRPVEELSPEEIALMRAAFFRG